MNPVRRLAIAWVCTVLIGICVATAWADGELDRSFGTNGVVKIAFPNSSLGYLYDAAVVNGSIEAAGFERIDEANLCAKQFPDLFVVQLSPGGAIIGSAHSYAQQAVQCPAGLIVDSTNGDIYVAGYTGSLASVAQFNASGSLVSVNTDPPQSQYNSTRCALTKPLLDGQHRLVLACMHFGEFGFTELAARRYLTDASQVTEFFFPRIYKVGTTPQYIVRTGDAVAQDASSGAYYVVGVGCAAGACYSTGNGSKAQYVIRLGTAGGLDSGYGDGGVAVPLSAAVGAPWGVTVDSSGNVLMAGEYGQAGSYQVTRLGYVARVTPTGMPDPTFGSRGVVQGLSSPAIDVQTDHINRVYVLGAFSGLERLDHDGQRDPSFTSSALVQELNGPGSAWQSMQFADSARSGLYLMGGAARCAGCGHAATTALIAKVNLAAGANGPVSTITVLNSSATTVMTGQSVTFTATVSGTNPTGTVIFKDGLATLGNGVSLASGSASFTIATLAAGSHNITASYTGDALNAASTSAVMVESVNAVPSSNGGGGSGGGGSFAWTDLCVVFLLALGSVSRARHVKFKSDR